MSSGVLITLIIVVGVIVLFGMLILGAFLASRSAAKKITNTMENMMGDDDPLEAARRRAGVAHPNPYPRNKG